MVELSFHEASEIFPMMSGSEFSGLIDDIMANGLLEPIWLHSDGRIIDGRNRYRACLESGIEPSFRTYDGPESELVGFVISLNLHRRHLDSGQLAFVALAIEAYEAIEAKKNQVRKPKSVVQIFAQQIDPDKRKARYKAAESVGTNRQYVSDAKSIREKAPELEQEVMDGSLSLPQAKQAARLDEKTRKAVVQKVKTGAAKNIKQAQRQFKDEERIKLVKEAGERPEREEFKIIVGDCLDKIKEIDDGAIDCIITDPPYGLETHRTREGGKDYQDGRDYSFNLLDAFFERSKAKLAKDAHIYVFSGYSHMQPFKDILKKHFWVQDNPLVWVKNNHTMCDFSQKYPSKHEYIWFCKNAPGRELAKCIPDVIGPYAPGRETNHSAEKPIELLSILIQQSTSPQDLILDPFTGSGSTAVAALQSDRRFIGFEIEERWANVARGRIDEL